VVLEECRRPSNTHFDSKDDVTAGGPYDICVCN